MKGSLDEEVLDSIINGSEKGVINPFRKKPEAPVEGTPAQELAEPVSEEQSEGEPSPESLQEVIAALQSMLEKSNGNDVQHNETDIPS